MAQVTGVKSKDFEITIPSLLFDPEFYLFDFSVQDVLSKGNPSKMDFSKGLSKFLIVREDIQKLAPFVDIRLAPFAQAKFNVSTEYLFALEGQHDIERPGAHFIFHHAFVCSTLLARCLNNIDAFFSLKEPWILRRLSDFKRARRHSISDVDWREMFIKNTSLLAKNYRSGKSLIIKATNVANNLIEDVIHFMPSGKILFLYSDLESFLVSNLKKNPETREKMPSLYTGFVEDGDFGQRFTAYKDPSSFSFLQVCALIWVVSIYNLSQVIGRQRTDRFRTLDMLKLLNDPENTLAGVSTHFGHVPSIGDRSLMADPDILGKNAKDPRQAYGSKIKQQEADQVLKVHGSEVQSVSRWINPLIRELGLVDFLKHHGG